MYDFWGFKVKFAQKRTYEIRHFRDRPPKINISIYFQLSEIRPNPTHSKLSCLFALIFSNWFWKSRMQATQVL